MVDARRHSNEQQPADDADLIARLAAGEHLGERHEAELARIAASPALSSVLRLALATREPAEALASGIAALHAPRVVPFAPRRRVLPWVAMAATVAGIALLASSLRREETTEPPALVHDSGADSIFGGSFDGAVADLGESNGNDRLFIGEFDS